MLVTLAGLTGIVPIPDMLLGVMIRPFIMSYTIVEEIIEGDWLVKVANSSTNSPCVVLGKLRQVL